MSCFFSNRSSFFFKPTNKNQEMNNNNKSQQGQQGQQYDFTTRTIIDSFKQYLALQENIIFFANDVEKKEEIQFQLSFLTKKYRFDYEEFLKNEQDWSLFFVEYGTSFALSLFESLFPVRTNWPQWLLLKAVCYYYESPNVKLYTPILTDDSYIKIIKHLHKQNRLCFAAPHWFQFVLEMNKYMNSIPYDLGFWLLTRHAFQSWFQSYLKHGLAFNLNPVFSIVEKFEAVPTFNLHGKAPVFEWLEKLFLNSNDPNAPIQFAFYWFLCLKSNWIKVQDLVSINLTLFSNCSPKYHLCHFLVILYQTTNATKNNSNSNSVNTTETDANTLVSKSNNTNNNNNNNNNNNLAHKPKIHIVSLKK
jgi:hypothetical protein